MYPPGHVVLSNIDFGGPRGLLLASLTRLTIHMAPGYNLMGIEIFDSDGKRVHFGLNGSCEIFLFLNGSKEERVNRVGMVENIETSNYPGRFQVFPFELSCGLL